MKSALFIASLALVSIPTFASAQQEVSNFSDGTYKAETCKIVCDGNPSPSEEARVGQCLRDDRGNQLVIKKVGGGIYMSEDAPTGDSESDKESTFKFGTHSGPARDDMTYTLSKSSVVTDESYKVQNFRKIDKQRIVVQNDGSIVYEHNIVLKDSDSDLKTSSVCTYKLVK